MADSILRLKVESQEYDQKIKRAAEGIQQYAQKCREAGGTLQYLDDGVLEFVQALGKMDTVATGTKQQLREMSNALTTLTMTYRGLTDEEKNSPFGQELAKGIQQLTERAGAAKDAMVDVEQSIKNASSDTRLFDQMAQGASVMTSTFQGLTGAGKLLGIEMGNDVEVIAKLQAAMAVTNSLSTIQNALQKQSALMQGVNAAKTALATAAQRALAAATGDATKAQAAYNLVANTNPYVLLATAIAAVTGAFYALGSSADDTADKVNQTTKAIDDMTEAANRYLDIASKLGASDDYLADKRVENAKRIRDYAYQTRENLLKQQQTAMKGGDLKEASRIAGQLVNLQQSITEAEKEYGAALNARRDASQLRQELNSEWDNLPTTKMKQAAINMYQNLRDQAVDGSALQKMYQSRIETLQSQLPKYGTKTTTGGGRSGGGGQSDIVKEKSIAQEIADLEKEAYTADEKRRGEIALLIQALDKELERQKAIKNELHGIAKEQKQLAPGLSGLTDASINYETNRRQGKLAGMEWGSAEYNRTAAGITDLTSLQNIFKQANGLDIAISPTTREQLMESILNEEDIRPMLVSLVDLINSTLEEGVEPIKIDFETGDIIKAGKKIDNTAKETKDSWKEAATAVGAVGSALQQLEDPGAKVAGIIGQAVANIALGFSQATSKAAAGGPWAWIAAIAGGLGTMVSTIAAIKSATHYAHGGIVPGNDYTDSTPVMVSSGELILNRSQQDTIARQLQEPARVGNATGGAPYVTGETIILGANNHLMRTGQGEIVTTGLLRRYGII